MSENFCHLHVHSEFSLLDGLCKVDKIFEKVRSLNQVAVSITDHGNMDSYVKAIQASMSNGIKYIPGCELYIVDDVEAYGAQKRGENKLPRKHLTLWAKNNIGVNAVFRLLGIANKNFFKGRPTIQWSDLFGDDVLKSNAIAGTACTGGVILAKDPYYLEIVMDAFDDVYLEVMPHQYDDQISVNMRALEYSKRYGLKIIGTNDVHYVENNHDYYHEVLLAIQSKTTWDDPKRWKFNITGLYLKNYDEMFNSFKDQGVYTDKEIKKFLKNTKEVVEKSNCKFSKIDVKLPQVVDKGKSPDDVLIEKVAKGFSDILVKRPEIKPKIKDYMDRIEEELISIIKLGFCEYFILVSDIIEWAKFNDILIGACRGSVGGSLVAYCLGITTIDSVEYGLLFARFISPSRIDLPDIDLDFEDSKRNRIKDYLKERFGKNKVASVSTFSEMHGRGVLRDVSRVFKIPMNDVDSAAKAIVVRSGGDVRSSFSVEDAFNTFEEGKKFFAKYPEVSKTSMALEGTIKNVGMHAAGVVISINDFDSGFNGYLRKTNQGDWSINWDKEDLEYMGLMKLDILGLNFLTILNEARILIKDRYGKNVNFYDMRFDDENIFKEFNLGNTTGIFQFSSYGIKKLCSEVGIEEFGDMAAVNALFRPGPLRSGLATEYTKRKKGSSTVSYIHPLVENITKSTYGIILYQEQIMNLLYQLSGMQWKTVDMVRKVVSKAKGEEQFMKFEQQFIDGCKDKRTISEEVAKKVFSELKFFGSYSFNLSHAVGYAAIAYWGMYVKVYYPEEFFESLLTWGSSEKKIQMYIDELKRLGLEINPVDINKSDVTNWHIENKEVYPPISILKGVGEKACESIGEWKKHYGKITEKIWLANDNINRRVVNSRVRSVIADSGALASLSDDYSKISYKLYPYAWETKESISRLHNLFSSSIGIEKLGDKLNKEEKWYFAQITETKFGYHQKVQKQQKVDQNEILGGADSLGGVYGYARDIDGGYQMITFKGSLYMKKKYEIEHSASKWALFKGNPITFSENIIVDDVYFEDEIMSCNFGNLKLPLYKEVKSKFNTNIESCIKCSLRKECLAPIQSEINSNVVILGEAPGKNEDKEGKNFCGQAGKLIWDIFKSNYNLYRENFSILNTVKCWPSITKNPKEQHIGTCSNLLEEDMKRISPIIILPFGRIAAETVLGEEVKISEITGQTFWSHRFNCWVIPCIHPASVLYGGFSRADLEDSIDKFVTKLEIFI